MCSVTGRLTQLHFPPGRDVLILSTRLAEKLRGTKTLTVKISGSLRLPEVSTHVWVHYRNVSLTQIFFPLNIYLKAPVKKQWKGASAALEWINLTRNHSPVFYQLTRLRLLNSQVKNISPRRSPCNVKAQRFSAGFILFELYICFSWKSRNAVSWCLLYHHSNSTETWQLQINRKHQHLYNHH